MGHQRYWNAKHDRDQVAGLTENLNTAKRDLEAKQRELEAKQREIVRLQTAMRLLKVDHRVGQIDVVPSKDRRRTTRW